MADDEPILESDGSGSSGRSSRAVDRRGAPPLPGAAGRPGRRPGPAVARAAAGHGPHRRRRPATPARSPRPARCGSRPSRRSSTRSSGRRLAVPREPDPDDRRRVRLELTAPGGGRWRAGRHRAGDRLREVLSRGAAHGDVDIDVGMVAAWLGRRGAPLRRGAPGGERGVRRRRGLTGGGARRGAPRTVAGHRGPVHHPSMPGVVGKDHVLDAAIVPERDIADGPAPATAELGTRRVRACRGGASLRAPGSLRAPPCTAR